MLAIFKGETGEYGGMDGVFWATKTSHGMVADMNGGSWKKVTLEIRHGNLTWESTTH